MSPKENVIVFSLFGSPISSGPVIKQVNESPNSETIIYQVEISHPPIKGAILASSDIIIRNYLPTDLEAVRTIFNQVIERGDAFYFEFPFDAEQMSAYIESSRVSCVATLNDRIVGGYITRANQPGRSSHIANAAYFVSPDARGLGFGELLGRHSLETARNLGFQGMQFNAVVANNRSAVRLWEKLGFVKIGTVPKAFRHADGQMVDLLILHRFL